MGYNIDIEAEGTGKNHMINKTISYYNLNAEHFVAETVSAELEAIQEKFADKLQKGAEILDFGCGSGRDVKYFLKHGFCVSAIDGSDELCKIASQYTGIKVKNMLFQELHETERYDGIWACSSILHLPFKELKEVLKKMEMAVKRGGIIYTSFKYGSYEGERNGRYFTDMTEDTFASLIREQKGLKMEEQWVTNDVRPERGEERWFNVILRKK